VCSRLGLGWFLVVGDAVALVHKWQHGLSKGGSIDLPRSIETRFGILLGLCFSSRLATIWKAGSALSSVSTQLLAREQPAPCPVVRLVHPRVEFDCCVLHGVLAFAS
jgi:hypothetical protein